VKVKQGVHTHDRFKSDPENLFADNTITKGKKTNNDLQNTT